MKKMKKLIIVVSIALMCTFVIGLIGFSGAQVYLTSVSSRPETWDLQSMDDILSIMEVNSGDIFLRAQADAIVEQVIKENGFDKLETDMEKVCAVNTWVKENVSYPTSDYEGWNMRKYGNSTIVNKVGDCCGFARVNKLFLDKLGVECHTVKVQYRADTSYDQLPEWAQKRVDNEKHAISAVKVEEQWYIIDTSRVARSLDNPITLDEFAQCSSYFNVFIDDSDPNMYPVQYWPDDSVAALLGLTEFSVHIPEL